MCIDRVGSIKDKCSTLKKRLLLLGWNVKRCVATNMFELINRYNHAFSFGQQLTLVPLGEHLNQVFHSILFGESI
jgi:hypothetical protein